MGVHSGSLRGQIVVQLIVAEPCAHKASDHSHGIRNPPTVDREPRKDTASLETTPDLIDPVVVKCHPLGLLTDHLRGFSALPDIICSKLSDTFNRVPTPTASKSVSPKTERGAQDGASGRGNAVSSVTQPEDEGRDKEDDSRECKCEPVTHILRRRAMLRNGHQKRGKYLLFPHRPCQFAQ